MSLASSPQAHPRPQGRRSSHSNTGRTPSDEDIFTAAGEPNVAYQDERSSFEIPRQNVERTSPEHPRGTLEDAGVEIRFKEQQQQEEDDSYLSLNWEFDFHRNPERDQPLTANKAKRGETLPLPNRPGTSATSDHRRKSSDHGSRQKTLSNSLNDLSIVAQKRVSALPPRLNQTDADYSTWSGNHIEDQLSEQSIKNGFFDKAHVPNEANPAKPTIAPHIKQRSAIQLLSNLVVSVYEQRQSRGRVTVSSTFKPPPRVTLTDTKRETWLRDLANETIPLRRLSRTIPHGIRGKVLLDHCLEKAIPIKRAIWLAQCVGANEVRAFKRKGISEAISMNNELKWVREWTIVVEQFIASLLEISSGGNWRAKFTYGLRLSTSLYSAGLLDRDHFLDWHLQHLESSSFDYLPLSLIMAQVYSADLLSSLRYCHRLIRICFRRLQEIRNSPEPDPFDPLYTRVNHRLLEIVQSTPEGFVTPTDWSQCRSILETMKDTSNWTTFALIQEIIGRNDRLHRALHPSETKGSSPISLALHSLNGLHRLSEVPTIVSKCLVATQSAESLIVVVLQWASSIYVRGYTRALLAARIMRELISRGVEADVTIIASLPLQKRTHGIDPRKLCYILIDLIQTEEFDVGRYLRWLIATGALNDCSVDELELRVDTCLLREMPPNIIPQPQVRLRNSLLRSLAFPLAEDTAILADLKDSLFLEWGQISSRTVLSSSSHVKLRKSSLAVAIALSKWVQDTLVTSVNYTLLDKDAVEQGILYDRTVDQVLFLRDVLERLKDYVSLVDLIQRIIPHTDIEMLMSSIKAIDANAEELCAIGSFDRLFRLALDQYRNLRMKRPPLKDFPQAFLDMQNSTALDSDTIAYLKHEITLSDQITSVISFTPASDVMTDVGQSTPSDLEEEIDELISTSASNKRSVVPHCFQMIAKEFQKQDYSHQTLIQLCMKLKAHDQVSFAKALRDWMFDLVIVLQSPFQTMFQICIGASLDVISDTIDHLVAGLDSLDDIDKIGMISTRVIGAVTNNCGGNGVEDRIIALQYRKCQRNFCQSQTEMLLRLLSRSIKCCQDAKALSEILVNDLLLDSIRALLAHTSSCLDSILESSSESAEAARCVEVLVNKIADPQGRLGLSDVPFSTNIYNVFTHVNELSIPFYKLALRSTVYAAMRSSSLEDVIKDMNDGIAVAMERDTAIWTSLLAGLDSRIAREVHSRFADVIMRIALQDISSNAPEQTPGTDATTALKIVDATSSALSETSLPDIVPMIVETVKSIDRSCIASTSGTIALPISEAGIHALLHLTLIHVRSLHRATHDIGDLVQALCNLFVSSEGRVSSDTTSFISDCIATINLDLDETRLDHISHSLGQLTQNTRIAFLCNIRPNPDGWLYAQQPSAHPRALFSSAASPKVPESFTTSTRQHNPLMSTTTAPTSAVPFALRRWEVFPDSTPNVGANDTALSLKYFDARKVL